MQHRNKYFKNGCAGAMLRNYAQIMTLINIKDAECVDKNIIAIKLQQTR